MTDTNTPNKNTGQAVSSNQPKANMTAAERKKYIEELKKKKEAELKEKKKKDKESKKSSNSGEKSNKTVVILIILLALASIVTAIYFINPDVINGAVNNKDAELDKTDVEIAEKIKKHEIDDIVKDLPKEKPKEDLAKKEPKVGNSFTLKTPCWIISHSSMAKEKYAKRNVEILLAKNMNCGYYWIPDYNPNGNKFYKVYFGPYNTKKEAQSALADAKYYSRQAYVMKLK